MTPEEMKKMKRLQLKLEKGFAQLIKDEMTVEEKIEMVNTPYNDLPEELKPGMTKRPQQFMFIRMKYPHIGEQRETFAARLIRYRDKHGLTPEKFCDICNERAKFLNVKTKITKLDMKNYENYNICPKIDKMTLMSIAMDVPMNYLAGYGPYNEAPRGKYVAA